MICAVIGELIRTKLMKGPDCQKRVASKEGKLKANPSLNFNI